MSERDGNIQQVWHAQPREEPKMSLDEIRQRAQRFEQRTRRWNVFTALLIVVIVGVELRQISVEPELLERVGDSQTIAAFVYLAYWYRRYTLGQTAPAGPATTQSVDFYREQLTRQRDMSSHSWRYLLPFVPGVALSLFGKALDRSPQENIAISVFAVALFMGTAWWHKRSARQLQRDIGASVLDIVDQLDQERGDDVDRLSHRGESLERGDDVVVILRRMEPRPWEEIPVLELVVGLVLVPEDGDLERCRSHVGI